MKVAYDALVGGLSEFGKLLVAVMGLLLYLLKRSNK